MFHTGPKAGHADHKLPLHVLLAWQASILSSSFLDDQSINYMLCIVVLQAAV